MNPIATVVIPTRNRIGWIREAVTSVEKQTLRDVEVVVVDDCSDDGTMEWLERHRNGKMRPIRLERHSERSATRNRGLHEARGEFVLFLDDDDRLVPRALERLVAGLRSDPSAVTAIGARIMFTPVTYKRAPHVRRPMTREVWPEVLCGWLPGWFAISGQSLFRTDQLRDAGGWNENLVVPEDQELQLRLSRVGPTRLIPWTVVEYRVHPGQWRPSDLAVVEDQFRRDFIAQLRGDELALALSVRRASRHLEHATSAYNDGRYAEALAFFTKAVSRSPYLFASPLTGPRIRSIIAKSTAAVALGRRGVRAITEAKGAVSVTPREDPDTQIRPISTLRNEP